MEKLIVINPGSTSTKLAYFEGTQEIWKESISHTREEISKYETIADQLDMRYALVLDACEKHNVKIGDLSCVAARGGPVAPLHSGAYKVTQAMVDRIKTNPQDQHASLLGALIAFKIAEEIGVSAYIYDAVTVDEMLPVCRIMGVPSIQRRGQGHNLNMRAAALRYCNEKGLDYTKTTTIVAHLGGGISVSLQDKGRVADLINDEDGPFAPERAGRLLTSQLVNACFSGKYTEKEIKGWIKGKGGLVAWLNTNDSRVVEQMIADGDEKAKLVYEAMALNVSKAIAEEAALASGKVDAIILTGGIAYSEMFTKMIIDRVKWIAPVEVLAGENEMQALANGAVRVLRGEEKARIFEEDN